MKILAKGAAKRLIFSLLLAGSLGGCAVYGPPPAAYGPAPYAYGPPMYAGPSVSLDLGFGFYDFGRAYHRGHRVHHGHHHGFRGHHGRGHRSVHHGHRGWRGGGHGHHRGWR